jgi:hypothetical protein
MSKQTMEAVEKADLTAVEGGYAWGYPLPAIFSNVTLPVAAQSNSLVNLGGNAAQGQFNAPVVFGAPTTVII